ncbi:MAG: hemerythrin domain-containing protein [Candidatus Nanopelagicales bacterium]
MTAIPHTDPQSQDVLDLLMQEHREVEALLDQISQPEQNPDSRDTADRVIAMLVKHSVAEEMYVYPVMEQYLPNGKQDVEHDKQEHQELEELLKQLEGLAPEEDGFAQCVSKIQEVLNDHVHDEEDEQFPRLREAVPADTLVDLRGKVEMAEKVAPTRPHPEAPHSELFHKVVGPGVGMVDRLRDALSGRVTE